MSKYAWIFEDLRIPESLAIIAMLKDAIAMIMPEKDWDFQFKVQEKTLATDFSSFADHIDHIPLDPGGWGFGWANVPAIPISLSQSAETVGKLLIRSFQTKQAVQGLTNTYVVGGLSGVSRDFLYGKVAVTKVVNSLAMLSSTLSAPPTSLAASTTEDAYAIFKLAIGKTANEFDMSASFQPANPYLNQFLDDPTQWSMSWTTFPDVYLKALPHLNIWASSLTSADEATGQFWPTIATYGLAFNLLVAQKVDPTQIGELKSVFKSVWSPDLDVAQGAGLLYAIDMRRFEKLEPQDVDGSPRFTPGSLVLLTQDAKTKALTPVAIRISGYKGAGAQIYCRSKGTTDSAWIYAIVAAKASITVYGIWLGHVYHWHIVTAAMQMTMANNLPSSHPVSEIFAPQSNYLIGFDNVLILQWSAIAPPTSISSSWQFFSLINDFAANRKFFDDDPKTTLEAQGIKVEDFTVKDSWDKYPIAGRLLEIWDATETYVRLVVEQSYPTDAAVAADQDLQAWINDSGNPSEGNVQGLPAMTSREALIKVLTSLVYRVTAHGSARLNQTANPAMTFVANFPPCLQDSSIPPPNANLDTKALLKRMPKTGTIGQMVTFLFTFAFSIPYIPFIPLEGIDGNLFYGPDPDEPRNKALIAFRHRVLDMLLVLNDGVPQRYQWPLNIET